MSAPASSLRSALVVLALAGSAARATAQPCGDTPSCLAAVQRAQANATSLAADFIQTKHVQLLEEPIVSRGRFAYRRPDRIRLDIDDPVRSTVVINGREVHIPGLSTRDREAMASSPATAMFVQLGALFGGDVQTLTSSFDVRAEPHVDAVVIRLVPRDETWRRAFRAMQVRFSGRELAPSEVRLDDGLGDSLVVRLENIRRNPDLPESWFVPPTPEAR